ncbi:MAG: pyrroline-5-carboxylate reductase [Gammaproteobacteria bacterium]
MKNNRICFLGCGNMGRSLIGGILANGYRAELLCGADPDPRQRDNIKQRFGIEVYQNNRDAINGADVVVLAIKPQVMQATLSAVAEMLIKQDPLIISIAAGIRLSSIGKWLQKELSVVRVMPNTPALIQAGAAALFANRQVSSAQSELAETILRSVGTAVWVDDEGLMDTVTALSGSGPAYFFLLMEVLEKAAVELGLPQQKARLLTMETAFGAAKMVMESGQDAATLRQQVTSPGGTTEQALKVLTQGGLEELFRDALQAAHRRSVQLADSLGDET